MEKILKLVIAKATQAPVLGDNGDGITADELDIEADWQQWFQHLNVCVSGRASL